MVRSPTGFKRDKRGPSCTWLDDELLELEDELLELDDELLELEDELLLELDDELLLELEDEDELELDEEDELLEGDELSLLDGPDCKARDPAVTAVNPTMMPKNFLFKNQAAGFFFFSSFSSRLSF
jgi:hypothetical protein